MATIARMHVELIARGDRYRRDIQKSRTATERLRHELTKTRSVVGLMAGAAGFGLAAKRVFEIGAAAEETASKFRTVFGDSTNEVQGFIDRFGTLAGLSQEQAQSVLATTGSIVQGMGFASQASARFSQEVVQLAGDLSSFNNIPIEETSLAIQAALTGEREQLKRLGIVIREADVQQRALAVSGKASASALTQQEKATATLQLITERAGVAVGDLARTQDSAANRARALGAMLRTIRDEIAVALLPVLSKVVEGVLMFVKGIQIMAAETAVVIARMQFWKEVMFGTEESAIRANDQLRLMRVAAEEVKNQIIGLNVELPVLNQNLGGGGGGTLASGANDASQSLNIASVSAATFASQLPQITVGVHLFEVEMLSLAGSTNAAAAAQERQNAALQEARGLLGFLGALGGLGLGVPFLGKAQSLLSAFSFAGGFASGGHIPAGQFGLVAEAGRPEIVSRPSLVSGPADVTPMDGGLSAAVVDALASMPRVPMTPEAYALTDWFRRVHTAASVDRQARGGGGI